MSWAWWVWPLTWLTNYRPSVLWRCWLGHLTHKIVSEMTYSVSSGTLNSAVPHHSSRCQFSSSLCQYTESQHKKNTKHTSTTERRTIIRWLYGTIRQIIHDLLLDELLDVEYYRDLEMWVRGHSRSLKLVPFESLGAVSYSPSIVNMAVCSRLWDIQCQRMAWPWKPG